MQNNRAAAFKQLGNHAAARDDCDQVLQHWPHNVKARCRRAEALEALEEYDEALDDVQVRAMNSFFTPPGGVCANFPTRALLSRRFWITTRACRAKWERRTCSAASKRATA